MKNKNNKTCLYDFLHNYKEIEIPNIQRDYVMGSGGENLKSLLEAMNICAGNQEKTFNFSCVMGCEENVSDDLTKRKKFYVYDGQQRLTTLVFLVAFIINRSSLHDNKYINEKENCKKFAFNGRDKANDYLNMLLDVRDKSDIEICDFTTYSISNLIKTYAETNTPLYPNINVEFLMKRVIFDLVVVDKMGDAEQFFMDLNDGVKLHDYEIYKAELNHKISIIKENNTDRIYDECINKWSLKIDNEWLEYFLPYKTDDYCEEEIEINFIKYCFRMLYVEKNGDDKGFTYDNLEWIEKEDVNRVYTIMDNVVKVSICIKENIKFLNYSWEDRYYQCIRGAYWNLAVDDYEIILDMFIKTFTYINPKKNQDKVKNQQEMEVQRRYDVLIWSYISNLDIEDEARKEYLRLVKKILNNNRIKNAVARYTGEKIYYCRYSVYGVPEYYGNKFENNNVNKKCEEYIWSFLKFNWYLNQQKTSICNFSIPYILDLWKELIYIHNIKNTLIANVLEREKRKYESNQYDEISKIENCKWFNGLVENIIDNQGKLLVSYAELEYIGKYNIDDIFNKLPDKCDWHYMVKNVNISWKISGGYLSSIKNVKIPMRCLTDFFTYDFGDNDIEKINDLFYKRFYKYMPIGWFDLSNLLCYPNKGDNGSYYAIDSKVTSYPIKKINLKQWFNESYCEITKNNDSHSCSVKISDYHYNWLKNLILSGKYETIYCSNLQNVNFIVIEEYTYENENGMNNIKNLIDEKKVQIIQAFGKSYYISFSCLKAYFKQSCNSDYV